MDDRYTSKDVENVQLVFQALVSILQEFPPDEGKRSREMNTPKQKGQVMDSAFTQKLAIDILKGLNRKTGQRAAIGKEKEYYQKQDSTPKKNQDTTKTEEQNRTQQQTKNQRTKRHKQTTTAKNQYS
ncbi:hypothetical protein CCACVL1_19145 [Corchorus capsularis]|uniref:Uncharacterized protein n=1 Tax=Corchorus capsularis TaxID=210143 RepID=A0A1R3HI41_COCAP|nr:hypothetical protein CCACVL1_19145 [Corchorus capsularis]